MKRNLYSYLAAAVSIVCIAGSAKAAGFVSGSTGADGAFAPTADTVVQLPASGVLNYTTVNIPAGVTVRFAQTAKVPVVMLTTGNVTIAGTIDISGSPSANFQSAPAISQNQGGAGGPGGYDGGWGGLAIDTVGGAGFGPGGGGEGRTTSSCNYTQGGGGGGFNGNGAGSYCVVNNGGFLAALRTGVGGAGYGSQTMLPLVGGSGGGGGGGRVNQGGAPGTGGGGGGGALLLVSAGVVTLNGSINARGGNSGNNNSGTTCVGAFVSSTAGATGGGGSGGAVRILAPAFTGTGTINVAGGTAGCNGDPIGGGNGAPGRSNVEIVTGGTFNMSALPALTFTHIGGVAVPANPVGAGDVVLPDTITNPVTVSIAASGVPAGTVVKLILNRPYGDTIKADSTPLAGNLQASTATASIGIPSGATVLMGMATYTLTFAMGQALSVYANNEHVESITLSATMGGQSKATLVTVSGKKYDAPVEALRLAMVQ